ncbi:hypothetical protein CONCODRAFT_67961 [Conidiobolus coronatus NRRL 28638]|uniref:FTP domain-containing protein n=1 Tax=Conidiobolus coronatus (strain ATCC 28846 / CBS 209.66 / NRRL 28638) TaxID=796925 RepID=A0A137PG00_CONC2|nr:hypothetical protein CONCODRAFT_67961 [Conidiobolus coronatus NRRL 28638]|eukprot:KXN73900.1 hypothetical protein CONCODRAFT_67961 [Conidiobolus coronatus NRRL 28638]
MNSKLLLVLICSLLALPQNYNQIFDNDNNVVNVESKFTRRAIASDYNGSIEDNQYTYPADVFTLRDSIEHFMYVYYGLAIDIDYKVTDYYSLINGLTYIELIQLMNGLEVKYANMTVIIDSDGEIVESEGSFNYIDPPNDDDEDWGSPVEAGFSLFEYLNLDHEEDQAVVEVISNDNNDSFMLTNISANHDSVVATKQYIKREDEELEKAWYFEFGLGEQFISASVSPDGEVVEFSSS